MCFGDLGDVDVAGIRKTIDGLLREIDDDAARKRFWFLPFSVVWRVPMPMYPYTPAKDGDWPDTAIVGLVLCVSNGGEGKSWEYRYTSPTQFKEMKDGKRKYKRRQMGIGSAKAAKGGVSLVEAREKAARLSNQVREGIDPIDAAKDAKFKQGVRAGEELTVFDAMEEYFRQDISHRSIDYRRRNWSHFNRIHKALNTVPIRTLAEHPETIVDSLGMRERWSDHRDVEEKVLFHLRGAINTVRLRCKITSNRVDAP